MGFQLLSDLPVIFQTIKHPFSSLCCHGHFFDLWQVVRLGMASAAILVTVWLPQLVPPKERSHSCKVWRTTANACKNLSNTVDGRNPATQLSLVFYLCLSHDLQGFMYPRWCRISSINSIYTLLQDGMHTEHLLSCTIRNSYRSFRVVLGVRTGA